MALHPPRIAHRADVEGLRALAVALVVAYHARVGFVSGGFVGVDVFFVVSGFLITSLLVAEGRTEGRVALGSFWARRLRRLLPASLVTLAATVLAGVWMLEPGRLGDVARHALAAVGFSANLVFWQANSDYLSGLTLPSPLLHFWSLAVEEQFYLVWPLVVAAVTRLGRRALPVLAVVAGVLAAGSFWWGVVSTPGSPAAAYYLLPSRAWEMLAGALLALVASSVLERVPAVVRAVAGWAGAAAVVWSAMAFDTDTVFPGTAALVPVVGTLAVLAAGRSAFAPYRVLAVRPLGWVGARSYGIYLWHWPVLVLSEARFGELDGWARALAVAVAVVLAEVSYRVVEEPIRRGRRLAAGTGRSIAYATVALTVAAGTFAMTAATAEDTAPVTVAPVSTAAPAPTAPTSPASTAAPTLEPSVPSGPSSTAAATTAVPAAAPRVLLVGDSTLAPLRWFEAGMTAITGFDPVLDAESCRRLANRSCRGREQRTPNTVAEAIAGLDSPVDLIVVMGGYHSYRSELAEELDRVTAAAGDTPVVLVGFRESLHFPLPGSGGKRSQYAAFNDIVAEGRAAGRWPNLTVADWNGYSAPHTDWFVFDGIHVNARGVLGLGEFLSAVVAHATGRPCPGGTTEVCVPPVTAPAGDPLDRYGLEFTERHCYADGPGRVRRCERDRIY